MARDPLTLPEEVLLLVLTKRDGSLLNATRFRFGMAGGILAELVFRGRVELEPGSVHPLVTVISSETTGDPVLDDALGQLVTATRRTTLKRWIGRFAEDDEICLRVARQLCRKEALDEHEGRVRLIFRRTVYADLDPEVEKSVMDRLRAAIMEDEPVDTRTALLVSLANAGEILSHILEPSELLDRKERMRSLVEESTVEDDEHREAVREAAGRIVSATNASVIEATTPVS